MTTSNLLNKAVSHDLIALPGTLMDSESLGPLSASMGLPFRVELLGNENIFDSEIERLAGLASAPAVWIGHSLGGIAALHLADRFPKNCIALIVLASNLRPDGPLGPEMRARQINAWEYGGLSALVREQLAPAYGLTTEDTLVAGLVEQAERVGAERFRRQLRYAADRPGLLVKKSNLAIPVLALSAQFDRLSPPACGDEIVQHVMGASARHFSLENAGHLLPVQHPDWCAQHILRFLEEIL